MTRFFMVLGTVLLLAGCSESTRTKMSKLEVGMTKAHVRQLLGEPYETEMIEGTEFWLYKESQTASAVFGAAIVGSSRDPRGDVTPVAFQNGKVVGWGKSYWQEKEHRYDIKIRQQ